MVGMPGVDVVAAVDGRLVILGAVLGPFHRAPQLHGRKAHQCLVRVARDLAAEPATHLRRDHADAMLGQLGHHRQEKAMNVRVLARDPAGELTGAGIVARARGARLHGGREQPVLHDTLLDSDRCFGERFGRVAARHLPRERDVARHLFVQLGRSLRGRFLGVEPLE